MQQSLERALDRAEYVIASAQQRPPKRQYSTNGEKSLYEKLYDIYVEECEKEPGVTEGLRSNVKLLEKLLRRESLPCLVVNLYPGKEGYSLMLKGENGSSSESIRLPYEEGELLEYLDAEELPPVLVDFLEKSQVNVFHRGGVIAEIRDYRQSSDRGPPHYQSRHIILRPTMQTLACDVEDIASDNQNWTQEDKLLLESQLILATAEPLCLDPSVSVVCTENRLLYNKQKLNTLPMKRSFKRYSVASLNRQQELSCCPPPPELRALTSCKKIGKSKTGGDYGLKTFKEGSCVAMWKQRPCDLAVPSEVDVEKYAKGKKSVTYDDSQSTVWPTHEVQDGSVFGCEEGSQSQTTKLTLQSLNDPLISGKRSSPKKVRRERQLSPPQSSTDDHFYSFVPGPKTDVGRVVSQSKELVQKSAQCPVQVSRSSVDSTGLRQPSPGKEPEQPKTGSVQSSVSDKGAKHPPPPITLPLNSGRSSSGDSFTSQQASSSHKSPSSAPAPKPPSPSQKFSAEVNQVSLLPATALSTAGSSQRTQRTQVLAISSGLKITTVVYSGEGCQASGRGSKPMQDSTTGATALAGIMLRQLPTGIKPGPLPTGIRPGHLSTGSKPGPLPGGITLGHQPTGVKPGPLPGGITLGHQPTGVKPGPLPGGITLGHQSTGVKPGPLPTGIGPGHLSTRRKCSPLPRGIRLDHQPTGVKPSPLPGGITLGHQPTGVKPGPLPTGIGPGHLSTRRKRSPLPRGIRLDHQPTGIKPSPLPGGITLGHQPTRIKTGQQPAGAQPPNVLPAPPPAPSQGGVQFIVKKASSCSPLALLQLPPDSLILNTQQQAQEQPQQQCFYHLIPQQQLQQPTTSHPQQPVPQAPVQGSVSQRRNLPAQKATAINLNEVEGFLQPQVVVLSRLGSAQSHPGPNLPQQGSQLSSALQLQLQPQPQPIGFRILQCSVAVTTVAAQTAQPPPPSEHTASQSEGKMKGSTPTPPKP
ncbi:transcription factor SPT20 homolog [Physeter macrocephalus]|uniref:Transcription factor SPT20 homolog n=1 Tax=Physeter macrocephalus TaxID=9755 RepID=A0A9W2WG03_PHYMC|nr:transcription factor SPT20 homolog [Physeter catodon]